jgi:hypothetical protein
MQLLKQSASLAQPLATHSCKLSHVWSAGQSASLTQIRGEHAPPEHAS